MVSAKTQAEDDLEPRPSKRQKLQPVHQLERPTQLIIAEGDNHRSSEELAQIESVQQLPKKRTIMSSTGFQPDREVEVGILHVVNSANKGFTGVLKHRYTDFMVNEITPDGSVVHLTDDSIPKPKYKEVPADIVEELSSTIKLEKKLESEAKSTPISDVSPANVNVEKTFQPIEKEEPSNASLVEESTENASAPKAEAHVTNQLEDTSFVIKPEDENVLVTYFGTEFKDKMLEFHQSILAKPTAKPAVFGSILTPPITDRVLRGRMHGDVRRIFESRLETEVQKDGIVQVTAAPPVKSHPEGYTKNHFQRQPRGQNQRQNQSKGKLGWQELGGEYLHFSLYKENKDTMEVIGFLASRLHIQSRDFAFAGTKDRRAVTVQRVSVRRMHADKVARLNRELRMSRVGNFEYSKHQLELGELQGNEFTITLRDCHFGADNGTDDTLLEDETRLQLANEVLGTAVEHLRTHGFINYYGLQRFGSFGIGTDEIGKRILSGAFKDAVDGILDYNEETLSAANGAVSSDKIARDDLDRAKAISLFRAGRAHEAVEQMPRKYSGERTVIQYLGRRASDYLGAIQSIHRNLKLMYVHAYQSLVWNIVASERWARYGAKVVEGDLVIVNRQPKQVVLQQDDVDEAGEVVIRPAADDTAVTHDDLFERAQALTAEEAQSGKYTIFDIVLPTPGFDIEYPNNAVGDFYKEFMASERGGGLDPGNMRRPQKDFSLSGSYRKVIGQAGKNISFTVKAYSAETEQLVETDMEKLNKSKPNRNGDRDNYTVDSKNTLKNEGGRFNGGGDDTRGGRFNNRRGRGRDGRGGSFFGSSKPSGSRDQNDSARDSSNNSSRIYHDIQKQEIDTASPVNEKMSAWQSLPDKLASEEKAARESMDVTGLITNPATPENISQAVLQDTFIETSVDDERRRTGHRATKLIGSGGKEVSKEEAEADKASVEGKHSRNTSTETDTTGGVKLNQSPQLSPDKKLQEKLNGQMTEDGVVAAEYLVADDPEKIEGSVMGELSKDVPFVPEPQPPHTKIAVVLKFTLGTSQYATMALRELMGVTGVKTYKPDFSGGR